MLSSSKGGSRDIQLLSANKIGCDWIIADLHGNSSCLSQVIKQLNPKEGDRLFVNGDLVDRGADSIGVIELLKNNPSIYVIKGNHETMTLTSIHALEIILTKISDRIENISHELVEQTIENILNDENTSEEDKKAINDFVMHFQRNGGEWLWHLFENEVKSKNIQISMNENNQLQINYSDSSKIKMVHDFMENLPYIIHIKGNETVMPFNNVHADMPVSDPELKKMIKESLNLSTEKANYAVWAREEDYDDSIRRKESDIAYCGHSIIAYKNAECVRTDSAMVNLDGAAYDTNISILVNHTKRKAYCVSLDGIVTESKDETVQHLLSSAEEIENYLEAKYFSHEIDKILTRMIEDANNAELKNSSLIIYNSLNEISEAFKKYNIEHSENFNSEVTLAAAVYTAGNSSTIKDTALSKFIIKAIALSSHEAIEKIKQQTDMDAIANIIINHVNNTNTIIDDFIEARPSITDHPKKINHNELIKLVIVDPEKFGSKDEKMIKTSIQVALAKNEETDEVADKIEFLTDSKEIATAIEIALKKINLPIKQFNSRYENHPMKPITVKELLTACAKNCEFLQDENNFDAMLKTITNRTSNVSTVGLDMHSKFASSAQKSQEKPAPTDPGVIKKPS